MVKSFQFGLDGLLFYFEVSMGLEGQGDGGVSLQFFMEALYPSDACPILMGRNVDSDQDDFRDRYCCFNKMMVNG
jgi:hypothetical protein